MGCFDNLTFSDLVKSNCFITHWSIKSQIKGYIQFILIRNPSSRSHIASSAITSMSLNMTRLRPSSRDNLRKYPPALALVRILCSLSCLRPGVSSYISGMLPTPSNTPLSQPWEQARWGYHYNYHLRLKKGESFDWRQVIADVWQWVGGGCLDHSQHDLLRLPRVDLCPVRVVQCALQKLYCE